MTKGCPSIENVVLKPAIVSYPQQDGDAGSNAVAPQFATLLHFIRHAVDLKKVYSKELQLSNERAWRGPPPRPANTNSRRR